MVIRNKTATLLLLLLVISSVCNALTDVEISDIKKVIYTPFVLLQEEKVIEIINKYQKDELYPIFYERYLRCPKESPFCFLDYLVKIDGDRAFPEIIKYIQQNPVEKDNNQGGIGLLFQAGTPKAWREMLDIFNDIKSRGNEEYLSVIQDLIENAKYNKDTEKLFIEKASEDGEIAQHFIKALVNWRTKKAVPIIGEKLLKYSDDQEYIEALININDESAVYYVKEAIAKYKRKEFTEDSRYKYLDILLFYGDIYGVEKGIELLDPVPRDPFYRTVQENVEGLLQRITGLDFNQDKDKWMRWYESNKGEITKYIKNRSEIERKSLENIFKFKQLEKEYKMPRVEMQKIEEENEKLKKNEEKIIKEWKEKTKKKIQKDSGLRIEVPIQRAALVLPVENEMRISGIWRVIAVLGLTVIGIGMTVFIAVNIRKKIVGK